MVQRLRQLPDPIQLPPLAVDGVPLPLAGWRHEDQAFGFTERRGPDGKFQAVILSYATGKPVKAWGCDTIDQASGIAAQEFAATAYGVKNAPIVIEDVVERPGPKPPKRSN